MIPSVALPRHFTEAWALLSALRPSTFMGVQSWETSVVCWSTEAGAMLAVGGDIGLAVRLPDGEWPHGFWRWTTSINALADEAMSVIGLVETLALRPGVPPVLTFRRGEGTIAELPGEAFDAAKTAESLYAKRLIPVVDLSPAEALPTLELLAATLGGAPSVTLDCCPDGVFLSTQTAGATCRLKWHVTHLSDLALSFPVGVLHPQIVAGLTRFRWYAMEDATVLAIELAPDLALLRGATPVRLPPDAAASEGSTRRLMHVDGDRAALLTPGGPPSARLALSQFEALLLPSIRYVAAGTGSPCATFEIDDETFFEIANFQAGYGRSPPAFSVNLSHRHPERALSAVIDFAEASLGQAEGVAAATPSKPGFVGWAIDGKGPGDILDAVAAALRLVWGGLPPTVRRIHWRRLDVEAPPFDRLRDLPVRMAELAGAAQLSLAAVLGEDSPSAWDEGAFELAESDDRILRTVVTRDPVGQRTFRDRLALRYGPTCALSGCALLTIVEAAHLDPYRADSDHDVRNGLLLRVDLHRLFDTQHLAFEPETLVAHLSPIAHQCGYGEFQGRKLACGADARPDSAPLQRRWAEFCMRWGL